MAKAAERDLDAGSRHLLDQIARVARRHGAGGRFDRRRIRQAERDAALVALVGARQRNLLDREGRRQGLRRDAERRRRRRNASSGDGDAEGGQQRLRLRLGERRAPAREHRLWIDRVRHRLPC